MELIIDYRFENFGWVRAFCPLLAPGEVREVRAERLASGHPGKAFIEYSSDARHVVETTEGFRCIKPTIRAFVEEDVNED